MTSEELPVGCEMVVSHFIDEQQAESQIEQCERMLADGTSSGRPATEARAHLAKAREFLRAGQFTRAFLYAIKARGLDVEMLPPSKPA